MTRPNRAADFLQNMNLTAPKSQPTPQAQTPNSKTPVVKQAPSRAGRKHIGGYFDLDTVEKVAVLRARLSLDNSELIKLAIDELHRQHMAQRAFGDV